MKTILLIDDDVNIGNMLEEVLRKEGYRVYRAYSGTEAVLMLSKTRDAVPCRGSACQATSSPLREQPLCPIKPDLVLLDLMLPGLKGEEVLPYLEGTPVIVISARASTEDKVEMLLNGASDYMAKPFEIRELTARIAVRLREADSQAGLRDGRYVFEDIVMETDSHEVTVQGQPVRLTRTEYAILKLLMRNPAQVITKSVMLERISEETPDCMESSLKVHMSNLRRKLRERSGRDYIEAVWGIGFKMKQN